MMDVPTTAYNLQANAVCKRMHQTVGNLSQALVCEDSSTSTENTNKLVDKALYIAQQAMCYSVHNYHIRQYLVQTHLCLPGAHFPTFP